LDKLDQIGFVSSLCLIFGSKHKRTFRPRS